MTDLGDNVVRSLPDRIIEIVCIKKQQEENSRKTLSPKDIAAFYQAGGTHLS